MNCQYLLIILASASARLISPALHFAISFELPVLLYFYFYNGVFTAFAAYRHRYLAGVNARAQDRLGSAEMGQVMVLVENLCRPGSGAAKCGKKSRFSVHLYGNGQILCRLQVSFSIRQLNVHKAQILTVRLDHGLLGPDLQFRFVSGGLHFVLTPKGMIRLIYLRADRTGLIDGFEDCLVLLQLLFAHGLAVDKQLRAFPDAVDLLNTDLPIHEIIRCVGYENRTVFYQHFQGKYHMTPKEYRKAL